MAKIVETPIANTSTPTTSSSASDPSTSKSSNMPGDEAKPYTKEAHVSKKASEVPTSTIDIPTEQAAGTNISDIGVSEEENEDVKCSVDFDLKGGSGLGLSSLNKKSDSISDSSYLMTKDIPSYNLINVETSDDSDDQSNSKPFVSDYEECVEDVDISQLFPYNVHKTTMNPKFLVVTNECDPNIQPCGYYMLKKTVKQKIKSEQIDQKKL
ncbi:hypothetical protein L1987_57754 [Smallanthus sonchifolius]|uniref:Uncharacterized protein n=1 Tax=Smallanthus sonchifolius TaxID=185202 RepID=A0ACB9DDV9_9ASTR|nr:hypothetical protein L1987_57754 [Smallanthus sonchifolius]